MPTRVTLFSLNKNDLRSIFFSLQNAQTAIPLDSAYHEHEQLKRAHQGMDEIISNASGIFGGLKNQHLMLKVCVAIVETTL